MAFPKLGPVFVPGGEPVSDTDLKPLLELYFFAAFRHEEIVQILLHKHSIHIRLITLKRRLLALSLRRRNVLFSAVHASSIVDAVATAVHHGHTQLLGARSLTAHLRMQHKLLVTRNIVAALQRRIAPEAVASRQRKRLRARNYTARVCICV